MSITIPPYRLTNWLKKTQFSYLPLHLLTAGLFLFTAILAMADTHNHLPKTPCDIRLVFADDDRGMPSISYKLSLQIRGKGPIKLIATDYFNFGNEKDCFKVRGHASFDRGYNFNEK